MEVILNDGPDRMLYFFVSLVQMTEDENRSVSYGSVEILKPDIKASDHRRECAPYTPYSRPSLVRRRSLPD